MVTRVSKVGWAMSEVMGGREIARALREVLSRLMC